MIVIGLTGSIGMGKSTTAAMFADAGIPVNDSDRNVHTLYSGKAVSPIEDAFPGTTSNGTVDRQKLSEELKKNPANFKVLEDIVHPLVREMERDFLANQKASGQDIIILDIPLLFETGADKRVDKIVVVSCDPDIQKERVLKRPGMTEEKFAMILSRQTPDTVKRARADFVIDTGNGMDAARQRVDEIIHNLRRQMKKDKAGA
jgi:dephospho-CoA kinase